jgi:sterol desaturase/sphingolipid hydroxylase (fatty acid hydroxylase superfamily)
MGTADFLGLAKSFLIFAMVCVPAEWIFSAYPSSTLRAQWWVDLAHALFNSVVLRVPLALMIFLTIQASELLLPDGARAFLTGLPLVVQVLLATALGDLGVYTSHRLLHTRLLWRIHAIHHSAENIDWLVAFRVHPLEMLFAESFSLLPMVFVGFSNEAIAAYVFIYSWQSLFNHANVKFTWGPMRYLIASPEFHHWHHADEKSAYDKNFAAQFVWWDWLFGTLHLPKGERPDAFGVKEPVPTTYLDQLLYPFRRRKQTMHPR